MFQKLGEMVGWNEKVLGETIGDYLGVLRVSCMFSHIKHVRQNLTLYIIGSLKKMNARQNLYDGYC